MNGNMEGSGRNRLGLGSGAMSRFSFGMAIWRMEMKAHPLNNGQVTLLEIRLRWPQYRLHMYAYYIAG